MLAFIHGFGPAGMPIAPFLKLFGGQQPQPTPEPELGVVLGEAEGLSMAFDIIFVPFLGNHLCMQYGVDPQVVWEIFRAANPARQGFLMTYLEVTQNLETLAHDSTASCLQVVRGDPRGFTDLLATTEKVMLGGQQHEELRQKAELIFNQPSDLPLRTLFDAAEATNRASAARFVDNVDRLARLYGVQL